MSRITDRLAKLNEIGAAPLLWANAAIGLLVGFAHGGFLLLVRSGKGGRHAADDVGLMYVTVPVAVAILVTAVIALVKLPLRWPVLRFHAVVLFLGALAVLYYGARVAILGIPNRVNFVWSPVFFGLCVAYPVFLLQRSFAREGAPVSAVAVQAPMWAIGVSLAISAVIMWRMGSVSI